MLADHISDNVIATVCELPHRSESGMVFQHYSVVETDTGAKWLAVRCDAQEDSAFPYYEVIVSHWTREQNLAFAKDVANGLLSTIAKWLEDSAAESVHFAEIVAAELPSTGDN